MNSEILARMPGSFQVLARFASMKAAEEKKDAIHAKPGELS